MPQYRWWRGDPCEQPGWGGVPHPHILTALEPGDLRWQTYMVVSQAGHWPSVCLELGTRSARPAPAPCLPTMAQEWGCAQAALTGSTRLLWSSARAE